MEEEKKKLYTYINGRIEYWDYWDDIAEYYQDLERSPETFDAFNVGYHDYSLEFAYDGSFLYPVDRDDRDGDISFRSIDEIMDLMSSHGGEYIDFLKRLAGHAIISDCNNMEDYYVYEFREKLLMDILDSSRTMTLYPEDFEKTHDWQAVCQQLDVDSDFTTEVNFKAFAIAAESEEIEEDEED